MTIAMCYLLGEGVVLGADSTTSFNQGGFHYYNNNQKLFELGEKSTIGVLTWGLGSLHSVSHRTLFANFSDLLSVSPASSVEEVAERWADFFYAAYSADAYLSMFRELNKKIPFDPASALLDPAARTDKEEELYKTFRTALAVGFCIAGRIGKDRTPDAYEIVFDPLVGKQIPVRIPMGTYRFWGAPNMADRLIHGFDSAIKDAILGCSQWIGTEADFFQLLAPHKLNHPVIPIRDAADFVYTCIHSTIKALKFSPFSQICGGPIELSVITTDRPFRWIRHKPWDAAIIEGDQL